MEGSVGLSVAGLGARADAFESRSRTLRQACLR